MMLLFGGCPSIAANWCFPALRRLEAIGGKAGLWELFLTNQVFKKWTVKA